MAYLGYSQDSQYKYEFVSDAKYVFDNMPQDTAYLRVLKCVTSVLHSLDVIETAENKGIYIDDWEKEYGVSSVGLAYCVMASYKVISEILKTVNCSKSLNVIPNYSNTIWINGSPESALNLLTDIYINYAYNTTNTRFKKDIVAGNASRAIAYMTTKYGNYSSYTPQAGDVMYRYSGSDKAGSSGHFGIVLFVDKDYFYTFEGNAKIMFGGQPAEGVGIFKYPLSSVSVDGSINASKTGFLFFRANLYYKNETSCFDENKDYTYEFAKIDGTVIKSNCFKKKEEIIITEKEKEKTTKEPEKPSEITTTTPPEKVKKFCDKYVFELPDNSELKHWSWLLDPHVRADIVYDGIDDPTGFIKNSELAQGQALWFKEPTNTFTGFGMFKDNMGNIIYVVNDNQPKSRNLVTSGLIDGNVPIDTRIIDRDPQGNVYFKQSNGIQEWLARNPHLATIFLIELPRDDHYSARTKQFAMDGLRDGLASRTNMINSYKPYKGEEPDFAQINREFGEGHKPYNEWLLWRKDLGLDYNSSIDKYTAYVPAKYWCMRESYAGNNNGVNTLTQRGSEDAINIFGVLQYIEEKQIKLERPIVIIVGDVISPKPIISQDVITIGGGAVTLAAMILGVKIPPGIGASFFKFCALMESAYNGKLSVTDIPQLVNALTQIVNTIFPDTVTKIDKAVQEYTQSVGKDIIKFGKDVSKEIEKIGNPLGILGQEAQNIYKSFKLNTSLNEISKSMGLDKIEIEKLIQSVSSISGLVGNVDLRALTGDKNFKDVQKLTMLMRSYVINDSMITRISNGTIFKDIANEKANLLKIPVVNDLFAAGFGTKAIGQLPKAPELVGTLLTTDLFRRNNFVSATVTDRLKSTNKTASLVAMAMGYTPAPSYTNIFGEAMIKSLENQVSDYAMKNLVMSTDIPFFLPANINDDEAVCIKYELKRRVPKQKIIHCPENYEYDPKLDKCINTKISVCVDFDGKQVDCNSKTTKESEPPTDKKDKECCEPKIYVPKPLPCFEIFNDMYYYKYKDEYLAVTFDNLGNWYGLYNGIQHLIDSKTCQMFIEETKEIKNTRPPCIQEIDGVLYYNPITMLNDFSPLLQASGQSGTTQVYQEAPTWSIIERPVETPLKFNPNNIYNPNNQFSSVPNTNNLIQFDSSLNNASAVVNKDVLNPIGSNKNTNPIGNNKLIVPNKEKAYKIDNEYFVFRNGNFYLINNCNVVETLETKLDCKSCENLVDVERQKRENLEKQFISYKVFNDSRVLQLEKNYSQLKQVSDKHEKTLQELINKTFVQDDSKVNELRSIVEREILRTNEHERLLKIINTNNPNDTKIKELERIINNEKERINSVINNIKVIEEKQKVETNTNTIIEKVYEKIIQNSEPSKQIDFNSIVEIVYKKVKDSMPNKEVDYNSIVDKVYNKIVENSVKETDNSKVDNSNKDTNNDYREILNKSDFQTDYKSDYSSNKDNNYKSDKEIIPGNNYPPCIIVDSKELYWQGYVKNKLVKLPIQKEIGTNNLYALYENMLYPIINCQIYVTDDHKPNDEPCTDCDKMKLPAEEITFTKKIYHRIEPKQIIQQHTHDNDDCGCDD